MKFHARLLRAKGVNIKWRQKWNVLVREHPLSPLWNPCFEGGQLHRCQNFWSKIFRRTLRGGNLYQIVFRDYLQTHDETLNRRDYSKEQKKRQWELLRSQDARLRRAKNSTSAPIMMPKPAPMATPAATFPTAAPTAVPIPAPSAVMTPKLLASARADFGLRDMGFL